MEGFVQELSIVPGEIPNRILEVIQARVPGGILGEISGRLRQKLLALSFKDSKRNQAGKGTFREILNEPFEEILERASGETSERAIKRAPAVISENAGRFQNGGILIRMGPRKNSSRNL